MSQFGGLYKPRTGDTTKQEPNIDGGNRYDRVGQPVSCKLIKTPNAVLFNQTPSNNVSMFFGSSASYATAATNEGGVTIMSGSHTEFGKPTAGTILNVHPSSISSSVADETKITLIYKSGLATGGF